MKSASFDDVKRALDMMADRHNANITDAFSCPPHCAIFAKAVVDAIEAGGGPCPKLLGDGLGINLTFLVGGTKVFYSICEYDIDIFEVITDEKRDKI